MISEETNIIQQQSTLLRGESYLSDMQLQLEYPIKQVPKTEGKPSISQLNMQRPQLVQISQSNPEIELSESSNMDSSYQIQWVGYRINSWTTLISQQMQDQPIDLSIQDTEETISCINQYDPYTDLREMDNYIEEYAQNHQQVLSLGIGSQHGSEVSYGILTQIRVDTFGRLSVHRVSE